MKRILYLCHSICNYLPFILIIVFISYILHAYIVLGYLPYYDDENQVVFKSKIHNEIMTTTFGLTMISIPINLILLVILSALKYKPNIKGIIIWILGFTILFLSLILDPGTFWEWYFD
jgi:hypothetical protein